MRALNLGDIGDHAPGHLHRDQRIAVDIGVRGGAEILGALDKIIDRTIDGHRAGRKRACCRERAQARERRGAACDFHRFPPRD
jgi:hypothetical protein